MIATDAYGRIAISRALRVCQTNSKGISFFNINSAANDTVIGVIVHNISSSDH
jgi:hypothetical protein